MCNLSVLWGKGVWAWRRVWLGGRNLRNLNYPLCVVCRGLAVLIYGFYLLEHLLQPVTTSFHIVSLCMLDFKKMLSRIKDTLFVAQNNSQQNIMQFYLYASLCSDPRAWFKGRCTWVPFTPLKTIAPIFLLKLLSLFSIPFVFMPLRDMN